MVNNNQYGFQQASAPSGAYGDHIQFNIATGITNIASTSQSKWATAGNLFAFDQAAQSGNYVECSVTYFASGGSQPQGWYFWFGYSGTSGTYWSISAPSTGDTVKLKLQYVSGAKQWQAAMVNITKNTTYGPFSISGAPSGGFAVQSALAIFEAGGNTVCSNYSSLSNIVFSNFAFTDGNGNDISYITGWGTYQFQAASCTSGGPCITETVATNQTTLTIAYHGCS
jgi:hypothetical protein